MKLKLLFALSLILAFAAAALGQTIDPDKAKESTKIQQNLRKVELLNQILPLAMDRNQMLQLLPTIERVREKQRTLMLQEHDALLEFDKKSEAAVADGIKG